jgi:hypothetical protein
MLNFNQTIDTNYPRSKIPVILTMLDLIYVLNLSNGSFTSLLNDKSFPVIDLNGQKYVLRNSLFRWLEEHENPNSRKEDAHASVACRTHAGAAGY